MKTKAQTGFSLIEILVAMAIAFIFIIGTADLLVLAAQSTRRTEIRSTAADLLSARMEHLKSLPPDADGRSIGIHETMATSVGGCGDFIIKWSVDKESPELLTVVMEVVSVASPVIKIRASLFILEDLGFKP